MAKYVYKCSDPKCRAQITWAKGIPSYLIEYKDKGGKLRRRCPICGRVVKPFDYYREAMKKEAEKKKFRKNEHMRELMKIKVYIPNKLNRGE